MLSCPLVSLNTLFGTSKTYLLPVALCNVRLVLVSFPLCSDSVYLKGGSDWGHDDRFCFAMTPKNFLRGC